MATRAASNILPRAGWLGLALLWLGQGAERPSWAQPRPFATVVRADSPATQPPPTEQPVIVPGEAARSTAGTLGDPFRVIGLLPGVATPLPMLPMFAVRGASPGMSGFYIDGMRVPQLFHMLIGGGVIHPGLIDQIEFHPGAYDVRFGRQNGGVATASTRPVPNDRHHLEAELRLLDVSALLSLRLPQGVRISVSGHYGYPGPILAAIDKRIKLDYWDYQLRIDFRGFSLQALGSYDTFDLSLGNLVDNLSSPNLHMSFHRLQLRHRWAGRQHATELALVAGLDQAGASPERVVRKLFTGFRASLQARWARVQLLGLLEGELSSFHTSGLDLSRLIAWTMGGAEPTLAFGEGRIGYDSNRSLGEIGEARTGGTLGTALQLSLSIVKDRLDLTLGARADLYTSGGFLVLGFDPRAQLRLRLMDWLALRIAGGVYQQPPSFPIQLPGIDTFALQLGLQRALHAAVTESLTLPRGLSLELTGYYQRFAGVTDLPALGVPACAPPTSDRLSGATASLMRLVDGSARGLEVLLRRDGRRFTGWLAYTLSHSERAYPCGLRPSDFDQTHVLNLVGQVSLPRGFRIGARLYFATGRPQTQFLIPNWQDTPRNNLRLPDYAQLDLHAEKLWPLRRGQLVLSFDLLNSTFSESALMLYYSRSERTAGGVNLAEPQLSAFRWLLPSLGLRYIL